MGDLLPFPKGVFFLISNEFCERFNYYGLRAILGLYITEVLGLSEHDTTIIYHSFAALVYTFPLFGAMIADSWLGKFKTILYVSIVYALGSVVLAISTIKPLNLPPLEFAMVGLVLIAMGTGGIKPCVSAFGGDQFELPQQEKQFETFFHFFYFAINCGSFLSMFITPIIRKRVRCFMATTCYPLAFVLPAGLMVIALVLFIIGKPFYKIHKPEGNMIIKVASCIWTAIKVKRQSRGEQVKKDHWLDYAVEKHGATIVNEIKIVSRVLFLYLPLPLFWALFEQQATGWTFQARRMNGELGDDIMILPDQMQVTNPILVLTFIPIFNYVIYPFFGKFGCLKTPLTRITVGGIFTGVSFIATAFVAIALEATYPILPSQGNGQFRIYNIMDCDLNMTLEDEANITSEPIIIKKLNFYVDFLKVKGEKLYKYEETSGCAPEPSGTFRVSENKAYAYIFNGNKIPETLEDEVEKDLSGDPKIRTIVNSNGKFNDSIPIKFLDTKGRLIFVSDSNMTDFTPIPPATCKIEIGKSFSHVEKFRLGGVYMFGIIAKSETEFEVKSMEITKPNSIHILWLIPQYLIITIGEIMLSISGLEFSYSEAPVSMKSVLQAGWLLTVAFGQIFVIIVVSLDIFKKQSSTFFLYAAVMIVDMVLFAFMAISYKHKKEATNN